MFLAKLGWTGHPQPSLQEVACGRAPYLPFQQDSWISATRISATCHVGSNTSTQIGFYQFGKTIAAKTSTSKSSKSKRLPVKTLLLKGVPLEASLRAKTCIKVLCVLECIYIYKYTHNLYVYIKILQCTYDIVSRCVSQVVDVPAWTMATVPQSPWS